jgi:tetratricopeptide (TPR) repeat protein
VIAAQRTFIALLTPALGLQWALSAGAAQPAEPTTRPTTNIRQTMLQTWREGISALQDKQAEGLTQAVRQLQSLAPPGSQSQTPGGQAKIAAGVPVAEAAAVSASAAAGAARPTTQPTTQPAAEPGMSPAELEQIKSMAVEKLIDAVGAADAVYQAGQYEAALALYQRLSDHARTGAAPDKDDGRDWLVFQSANCNARLGRHEQAAKLYQELIAGFPKSPWVAVAKVQGGLASWQQAEKPADLLKQVAPAGGGPRIAAPGGAH